MSRRRALLCVMLAASLCAPLVTADNPAGSRDQPIPILAFASSSTILVNPGGLRVDSRERTAGAPPFLVLAHRESSTPDRGRSV